METGRFASETYSIDWNFVVWGDVTNPSGEWEALRRLEGV